MASYVSGSYKHTYVGNQATLGRVELGDVICVAFGWGIGSDSYSTDSVTGSDNLGNTYTEVKKVSCYGGGSSTMLHVLTTKVTVAGNPTITVTSKNDNGITTAAFRGIQSSTPHVITYVSMSTANPLYTSPVTTTDTTTMFIAWLNERADTFTAFTNVSGLVQLNHDTGHFDANGYALGLPVSSSYKPGITGNSQTNSAIIAIFLSEESGGALQNISLFSKGNINPVKLGTGQNKIIIT